MASATQSFALTKIQPPRARASLVARERLEDRMTKAALGRRLVLLAAPAGFGKTAALARLIERLRGRASIAWISADVDDDPLGLLACLIAALEPLDPPWRTDPEALIAAAGGSRSDRHAVATQLLNALAACDVQRGLIVLDDAHRVSDAAVFEFLDLLLERLPPNWGVIVASRTDPPLASLARLRAHGELAEFRQRELRFTLDEVRTLLPAIDADASLDRDATSQRLFQRTHGWAVGLRLAVNGILSGHDAQAVIADTVNDRHVFDYLLNEVLGELPLPLRCFLLRCSVLDELTAGRCAAVSADPHAAQWLEEIERRGLFVSVLQGAETTLRLHDLFRDFLRDRLRREMADELPTLYRRAAAGETDMLRRIGFLVGAGDWSEAEATLRDAGATIIATVGVAPVLRLLDKFPAEARSSSPNLLHMRCLAAWSRWDWATMREAAAAAGAAFARSGEARLAWRSGVYESIAHVTAGGHDEALKRLTVDPNIAVTRDDLALAGVVHSYIALDSGRLADVAPRYREMLELLEPSRDPVLWYQCVPRSLQCGLPSMREPSRRFAVGALAVAPETPTPLRAIALASSAWSDVWSGRLEAALKTAALAEADARWLGPPPNVRLALYSLLAVLFAMLGRRSESYGALDEILVLFDDPGGGYRRDSPLYAYYRQFAIRLADWHGDGARVERLAGELDGLVSADTAMLRPLRQAQRLVVPGRLAWHRGQWREARDAFGAALAREGALAVFGEDIEVRLRLAQACVRLADIDGAATAIAPVFEVAEREGCPGAALTCGSVALAALAAAPWNGRLAPARIDALRRWSACLATAPAAAATRDPADPQAPASAASTAPRAGGAPVLVAAEALSPRELEVLRLIAAGDSNKLIARAFDLSPHTVKRHVANILDKLGVQSRGQAAAWFNERRPD
ncbi:MAG TPA: LuxR C-terminal-related transcriptional regulator [Caldimonas sp.]|nr:LuxR C-terminal-related transcriptional regulator [Caldimonas sp.]HEV7576910.1 LuxR C-terminal-related transcriptional regulator [Caldimonas sp.]